MRSSKSRSRSKGNRSRSMGNIVNRVFDSSGPEGKVRGTPQQIIDKYTQLARDAQLGNDRVAAENFQQHAEHYTRMLGEALREQEARRDQQEGQQQQGQQRGRDGNRGEDGPRFDQGGDGAQRGGDATRPSRDEDADAPERTRSVQHDHAGSEQSLPERSRPDQAYSEQGQPGQGQGAETGSSDAGSSDAGSDVIDVGGGEQSGLVDTPESKPKPARRPRSRKPKAEPADKAGDGQSGQAQDPAPEGAKTKPARKPRSKARSTGSGSGGEDGQAGEGGNATGTGGSAEAAE